MWASFHQIFFFLNPDWCSKIHDIPTFFLSKISPTHFKPARKRAERKTQNLPCEIKTAPALADDSVFMWKSKKLREKKKKKGVFGTSKRCECAGDNKNNKHTAQKTGGDLPHSITHLAPRFEELGRGGMSE